MRDPFLSSRYFLPSLLLLSVYAVSVSAQTLSLQRSAVSGALASIAEERSWDSATCNPQTAAVTILAQPANGTVSVREETLRIPNATPRGGSTGACAGRPIIGQHLYYQSRPGFVGAEQIVYSTNYGGSQT